MVSPATTPPHATREHNGLTDDHIHKASAPHSNADPRCVTKVAYIIARVRALAPVTQKHRNVMRHALRFCCSWRVQRSHAHTIHILHCGRRGTSSPHPRAMGIRAYNSHKNLDTRHAISSSASQSVSGKRQTIALQPPSPLTRRRRRGRCRRRRRC